MHGARARDLGGRHDLDLARSTNDALRLSSLLARQLTSRWCVVLRSIGFELLRAPTSRATRSVSLI